METIVYGRAEDDIVANGGYGTNYVAGGTGSDILGGGQGDDVLDSMGGSDRVNGGSGNDILIYRLFENAGATDLYMGGFGQDTVRIELTLAEWKTAVVQQEIARYLQHLDTVRRNVNTGEVSNGSASDFTFQFAATTKLTVSMMEKLELWVAGVKVTDPRQPYVTEPVVLAALAEDTARTITQAQLLANVIDIDTAAASLVVTGLTITSGNGVLTSTGPGTWSYTPAANDDTNVTFGYTVSDGSRTASASATLDITPVNDAPTATPVTLAAITEDSGARLITQAELCANGADIEGNALVASNLVKTSGGGTLVDNGNGTWSYTPAPNDDTSVSFSYTLTDNGTTNGVADPKSVATSATLDISSVNDAPVVSAPVALTAIAEDSGARLITQAELLGTASDIENDTLTASDLTVTAGGGTLVANGAGWNYTPDANYNGAVSFSYTITDNGTTNGAADPKSVATSASLTVTAVNDAPVVSAPVALTAIAEDSGARLITQAELLGTASDIENDTLTASDLTVTAGGGTLVANGAGWNYTPDANYNGAVSFSYTITDNGTTNGAADPKSVATSASLTVTAVNDAPVVSAPVALTAIAEDSGARLITQAELLGTASDIENDTLTASDLTVTAGGGTLVANGAGWNYTPDANYNGAVSFSYTITDNGTTNGAADPKSVATSASLTVTAVNDAPVVSAPVALTAIAEDSGARLITQAELLGTASDIENDTLTASDLTVTAGGGTLVANGAGWNYTPDANYNGAVSFSYTITDNGTTNGAADPKSVTTSASLTVTAVNDAPVVSGPVTLTAVAEDSGPLVITKAQLLANATDVDSVTLHVSGLEIAPGGLGAVVDNGNGTWTYTPALNDDTGVVFTYTVSDGSLTAAASANLDITPVNDAPTIDVDGAVAYVKGGPNVAIDSTITIGDVDSVALQSATVAISSNFTPGDQLNFTNQGGITGSYNSATGLLTLVGIASLAAYETALESVTFATTNSSTATRQIAFGVTDAQGAASAIDVASVQVSAPANAHPVAASDRLVISNKALATFSSAALLSNDTDPEGNQLHLVSVSGANVSFDAAAQIITYNAAPLSNGAVNAGSFTYVVSDGVNSQTGTVTIDTVNADPGFNLATAYPAAGSYQASYLDFGGGNDTGTGGAGMDTFLGGNGNDVLIGGSGADKLVGEAGEDTLTGQAGADVFAYGTFSTVSSQTGISLNDADLITDFSGIAGGQQDKIQTGRAGTAANYSEQGAVANFAAALTNANTAMNGTVVYHLTSTAADGGLLFIDSDSNGTADAVIRLTGINSGNFAFEDIIA